MPAHRAALDGDGGREPTRGERRARRRQSERERIQKHGKNLAQVYRNAVLKRLADQRKSKTGAED
jgi:hypothetical protein